MNCPRILSSALVSSLITDNRPPVALVYVGVLLVASPRLDTSIFQQSVVLLTHYDRQSARGVILTQPMATGYGVASLAGARHFMGGPVGRPGGDPT